MKILLNFIYILEILVHIKWKCNTTLSVHSWFPETNFPKNNGGKWKLFFFSFRNLGGEGRGISFLFFF